MDEGSCVSPKKYNLSRWLRTGSRARQHQGPQGGHHRRYRHLQLPHLKNMCTPRRGRHGRLQGRRAPRQNRRWAPSAACPALEKVWDCTEESPLLSGISCAWAFLRQQLPSQRRSVRHGLTQPRQLDRANDLRRRFARAAEQGPRGAWRRSPSPTCCPSASRFTICTTSSSIPRCSAWAKGPSKAADGGIRRAIRDSVRSPATCSTFTEKGSKPGDWLPWPRTSSAGNRSPAHRPDHALWSRPTTSPIPSRRSSPKSRPASKIQTRGPVGKFRRAAFAAFKQNKMVPFR